jgi:predicted nucleic acid-binding protein
VTADKVVDASALAAASFVEPRASAMVAQLGGHRLFAPTLLRYEVAHVCIKKIRERPLERNLILSQYRSSLQTAIQLVDVDHAGVVSLAEKFGLSAYDASYLWLALERGMELVTGDDALKKAFKSAAKP